MSASPFLDFARSYVFCGDIAAARPLANLHNHQSYHHNHKSKDNQRPDQFMMFSTTYFSQAMGKRVTLFLLPVFLLTASVARPTDASFIKLYPAFAPLADMESSTSVPLITSTSPYRIRASLSGLKLEQAPAPFPAKIRWLIRSTRPTCQTFGDCRKYLRQVHIENIRRMSKIGRRSEHPRIASLGLY
ncbi:hypothetical protein BV898_05068 [Hypsibius exemplaris]|uniref:Uncharacterized protein n=1 Tax=Hypsibius exemplaris TaxID=2072580 RepID=A0A1W0X0N4_HYPEX|nr:hypothetical protein BV898_05068 [Hypsibius exemplaris]